MTRMHEVILRSWRSLIVRISANSKQWFDNVIFSVISRRTWLSFTKKTKEEFHRIHRYPSFVENFDR